MKKCHATERSEGAWVSTIILGNLENFLNKVKIGSVEMIAFADLAKTNALSSEYGQIILGNKNAHKTDTRRINNLTQKLFIVEERIKDRKATLPGYNKAHQLAQNQLCSLMVTREKEESSIEITVCHSNAVKAFYNCVEKRLDKK